MNTHSEKTLRFASSCFFISICTSDTTVSARALVESTSLARVHVKVSAGKFTGEFFPVPQPLFAGFAMERVETDPQRTCTVGDFFISHTSDFSPPPPKLQQMTLPVPSCQASTKVHTAFRKQAGNRSLDHFDNSEKCRAFWLS